MTMGSPPGQAVFGAASGRRWTAVAPTSIGALAVILQVFGCGQGDEIADPADIHAEAGCVAGEPCDDGDLCTTDDLCEASGCKGTPRSCDDDNACSADTCDSQTGDCKHAPINEGAKCDDGSQCTKEETCTSGVCSGEVVSCDDEDPCTKDTCDPKAGCQTTKQTGLDCDDGNNCTTDICHGDGTCTNEQVASTCLIGGTCYAAGTTKPDAPCQACRPEVTATAWSAA